MDNFDEKTIIQKAMQGDESAFETLILSCSKKAYNIAFRYLRNEEDAQDAVQESFIKLYRHLASFNFNSKFDTWFYRIVVNVCNDILRKRKVQQDTFHPLEYAGIGNITRKSKTSCRRPRNARSSRKNAACC